MPRVSVLMPCFNAAPHVGAAIESALGQTWKDVEVIAVDDGSTDETLAVLKRYEGDRVHIFSQANRGQSAAANEAYARSSGDLVKFFDADDVMHPEMIERQVRSLSGATGCVSMGEWVRFYSQEVDVAGAMFEKRAAYRSATPVEWLTDAWNDAQPMMQCALWLIPRSVLERSGIWNEALSLINDFEFFTRVLINSTWIEYAPGARIYYRSGVAGSLSGQKSRRAVESAFLSISLATPHLLRAEDCARTRRACANIFQSFDYEHYPRHADLRTKALQQVAELGGSDLDPSGPPRFHTLRKIIGWRAARRVQMAMGR